MNGRAFFIGGPGTLSAATIDDLLRRGYEVGVFSLGSKFSELDWHVKTYAGSRDDLAALQAALDDFKPDVVLDFVLYTPQQAREALLRLRGKLRQYVFVSTVDVYGYPLSRLPLREDDPWHVETQSPYAELKRQAERIFQGAYHQIDFPLTIARPAYSYGPRFILNFTSRDNGLPMLRRLKDGRPVLVPGDGTTLMHAGSAWNVGQMIAQLVDEPLAIGKDYTVAHPTFTTQDEYVWRFARALGVTPNLVHVPSDLILSLEHPEIQTCLLHALTRFNVAFSIDRFQRDFPEFRPAYKLEDWTRYTVAWNQQHGLLDAPDAPIIDDLVLAAWARATGSFSI